MGKSTGKMLVLVWLAVPAAMAAMPVLADPGIEPFRHEFRLETAGLPVVVTAERRLNQLDAQTWQMELEASNLIGSVHESTRFVWTGCVPRTIEYRYTRIGLGQKREASMRSDPAAGMAYWQSSRRGELEYPIGPATTDKLALSLALQCMLRRGDSELLVDVAEEKRLSEHLYRVEGEESIETPAGTFRTVRVARDRGAESDRKTWLWFALDNDYALVRLLQEEDGKRHELILQSL